ncbi:MAG: response regulator [Bacteroidales bacterium]|nr:response regulator [Bacteroidales bacterium]
MLNLINIEFRTFIFIVEFNTEFAHGIIEGIDIPKRTTVRSFPSGEKFINHLSTLKFRKNDLVIVFLGYNFLDDYKHSLMNGIEILESIKHINPKIEVVMMAEKDETEYGAYVMKLGAHSFIPKDDNITTRANNIILQLCGSRNIHSKKRLLKITFIVWLTTLMALIISLIVNFN